MLRCSGRPGRGLRATALHTSPAAARQCDTASSRGWKTIWHHPFSTPVDGVVDDKKAGEAFGPVTVEEQLWTACAGALRTRVPEATWQSCFGVARPVALDGECLVLSVPSALARQRIEGRYLELLREALAEVAGAPYDVRLEVSPAVRPADGEDEDEEEAPVSLTAAGRGVAEPTVPATAEPEMRRDDMPLNPRYTFDAFVIGASNRFAHAAALSVAET